MADGMGGHAGGALASALALQVLLARVGAGGLTEAVHDANRAVWERAATDPEAVGMGTTVCAMTFAGGARPSAEVANVGDSRAFLYRGGILEQITVDHSLVAELERSGALTAEQARRHPHRNVITRALGLAAEVEVDRFQLEVEEGDRYLLCSDGLTNAVEPSDVVDHLREEADPQAAAGSLVQLANAAGGRDNVTVVIVDVTTLR